MHQPSISWFRDARFGMFLHFGLYTVLGRNEWSLFLDRFPVEEYAQLADRFVPDRFDADAWARVAADSGMKYMVLTARHHDGFCLYDSQVSDFTSVKHAAHRDFVAEYVEACRRVGVKVGIYYSLADWRYRGCWDPIRYPESSTAMVAQTHAQVEELMTRYGKIDLLWYDGAEWQQQIPVTELWRSRELNAMVRRYQPEIVINDRSGLPEDYSSPECIIRPPDDEARAWESCLQMDDISWGNIPHSPNLRTAEQIVVDLVEVAAGAGNLLLNTGPQADGRLRPQEEERILQAGAWLQRNAAAIYSSRRSLLGVGGPMGSANRMARWIGTTDPRVHYLAALCWMGSEFMTVLVDGEVSRVCLLTTGEEVQFTRGPHGRLTFVNLPPTSPDPLTTIFRVEFAEPPKLLSVPNDGSWLESTM
ncbi:MAG: alpha-L-fucosidase [Armatimonadota bacterium]